MSFLARFSLANRALIALITIAVTAFGLIAIPSLKQQLLPSLEIPAAFITAQYSGASPDVVESQVTEPIEEAVRGVAGVTGTTSSSLEGFATVQVELEYGTDLGATVNKLQQALDRAQLPADVDPSILSGGTDDFLPAVALSASGGDTAALAQKLQKTVLPELNSIEGVREATLTGAPDKTVVIRPDLAKLSAAGLSPQSISTAISSGGTAVPAGQVADGTQALTVQVGGGYTSLDDLKNLYLTPSSGDTTPVKLGDVAGVESVQTPATSVTRTNGKDSLGISVTMTPDGNAVDISHAISDKLDEWTEELGEGAELTIVFDQAPFIEKSISSLATEGGLGLVMAVIVILVFLLSVRSTLVTAVSIPLSVLIALIVMWADGLSLNVLTLGALTIAIGRVVDDSIVVLENIKRHLGYGEEKITAIFNGVREVAGAVTASTLTTVAVFAPIALVGGLVGELFRPFAITVTVALLASLVVALTIVPVLAYWFLRQPKNVEDAEEIRRIAEEKERKSFLQRVYVPVIGFAVRRRWTTIAIAIVILIATLGMVPFLKTNFLDQSGQNTLSLTQTMPVGSSLATTDAAAKKVEAVLAEFREDGDLESYQVTIGGGVFGLGGNSNSATYQLTVNEDEDTAEVQEALEKKLDALSDAGEIEVGAAQSGVSGTEQQVIVQAPDEATLRTATDAVTKAMDSVDGLDDVSSDLAESTPRVEVSLKDEVAAQYGLTEGTLGQIVAAAFRGAPAGQIVLDGVEQPITVLAATPPATVDAVKALTVPTPTGVVPLSQVADVKTEPGPVEITRIDGARSATVSGTPSGDNLGTITADLQKKLDALDLPAGASFSLGGASEDQAEAFQQLGLAVLAAIAIVFIVMVATFRSLIQPLILLVSIPFAATGALLLLLVSGTALGVPALIGMLMLVGIVVTNAIVLMDLVNQYRRDGMPVVQAVVEGGRHRLRPILMTAAATIFALIPMALGLTGEGGFISQPLAVVVIGGLISSTLLTLVLVPALYTLVEGRKDRKAEKRRRKAEAAATPEPEPAIS
ncbi:efflux RND transporter permease subunit [Cryptosporangium aurantiacum]|uniref:Hydrophobic/amphiphilic exporter-1, HAE1 family n=1 Tax=Cryptosporangium aurantiacum TaxID=134849 RepID=A0A1M7JQT8_9ACTN|nr:efflux RND transporter permease subunit [Cryptosporangium aurantiacum]SHM54937.1 hydrophobic/amphiphilic exporter-1, HAE1 family [Cryptosporangium aurantiacum]